MKKKLLIALFLLITLTVLVSSSKRLWQNYRQEQKELKEIAGIMKEIVNKPIPMSICIKCGSIGIGEETIGKECSCQDLTVRLTDKNLKLAKSSLP